MRWTTKARIQRACATLRYGDVLYRQIQKRVGTLTSCPFSRFPQVAELLTHLSAMGFEVKDSRCLEVGTGHLPTVPVALYLAGAREVTTVDLHRRLDLDLTAGMLRRMVASQKDLVEVYDGLVERELLMDRLVTLRSMVDPLELFKEIGLQYIAPADAGQLPSESDSFDLHFSVTVLEHVTPEALPGLLTEAHRLLRPKGVAAHLIDASDHFAHQDKSINRINFLRFSERDWVRMAGNEFAYTNRLRASELLQAFTDVGFDIERKELLVDERCLHDIENGFPVHKRFSEYDAVDLSTTKVRVFARKP